MRRFALTITSLLLATACNEVGGPPPSIVGNYRLVLVGNSALPFALSATTTLTGATLEVNADGSFAERRDMTVTGTAHQAIISVGNWTTRPEHQWQFVFTSPTRTDTATVTSSRSLSLRTGGRDWLYQR